MIFNKFFDYKKNLLFIYKYTHFIKILIYEEHINIHINKQED